MSALLKVLRWDLFADFDLGLKPPEGVEYSIGQGVLWKSER
jgi:hypothetical protein